MKFLKSIIIMSLLFVIGSTLSADAQMVVRKAKDSTVIGTKYITFTASGFRTTGFNITAKKDTGTVAATITLERMIDTVPTMSTASWKQLGSQSLTLTNTSSVQGDIFPITLQDGVRYRFKIVTTGGKSYLWASYLHW